MDSCGSGLAHRTTPFGRKAPRRLVAVLKFIVANGERVSPCGSSLPLTYSTLQALDARGAPRPKAAPDSQLRM